MTVAKRLNMDGGHFIWLWADTKNTEEFFDMSEEEPEIHEHHRHSFSKKDQTDEMPEFDMFSGESMKIKREIEENIGSESEDRHRLPQPFENFNEWLMNDTASSLESGERKHRRTSSSSSFKKPLSSHVLFHQFKDFPVGLLALKPIKITTDYNFVKSTIRLFVSTWAEVRANSSYLDDDLEREFVRGRRRLLASEYKSRRRRHLMDTQFIVNKVNRSSSEEEGVTSNSSNITRDSRNSSNSRSDNNKSSDIYDNFYKINDQNSSGLILNNKKLHKEQEKQEQQHQLNSNYNLNSNYSSKSNILIKLKLTNFTSNLSDNLISAKRKRLNWWPFLGNSGQGNGRLQSNSAERFKISANAPYYRDGCFGVVGDKDVRRAKMFAR